MPRVSGGFPHKIRGFLIFSPHCRWGRFPLWLLGFLTIFQLTEAGRAVYNDAVLISVPFTSKLREACTMRELDLDTLLFFDARRDALPLFAALEERLYARFPETQKRVQKTQISYFHKHVYACVSFARVRRRAELPETWLTLTLGLPYPLDSARVAVKTEVSPGRWTTHFVVGSPEELDRELLTWIEQAYAFSES